MYKIKQVPEDFIVNEVSSAKPLEKGKYSYFLMKKKNYTTLRAVEAIARALRTNPKKIGFAGNKDKNAITSQACSVLGFDRVSLERISLKDIEIEFLGFGDSPICLGDLEGNSFEITVRNIGKKPKIREEFINYFGEQRFGKNNADIGRQIIKRDFRKAVSLVLESKGAVENEMEKYLLQEKNDYIGALRKIPLRLLRMYVHAYQSFLWNKAVSMHKEKTVDVPIIGFGIASADKCTDELMKEEGITFRDFVIKEIPELSSEGSTREIIASAEDLTAGKLEKDELNTGMKKILLKFRLSKGIYATEYIKQSFA